jgi:hypothetical protein
MRFVRGVVAGGVLALLALAGAAAAAGAGCAPGASRVLASSGSAQLYIAGGNVHGCLGSRDTLLGPGPALRHPTRIALEALAGRFAGVDVAQMGVDTFASSVKIVDLATGATVAHAPATSPERAAESFVEVAAMAINANGVLAWIGRRSSIGALQPVYELHVLSSKARVEVAQGTIALADLQLSLTKLSWREGRSGPHKSIPLAALH